MTATAHDDSLNRMLAAAGLPVKASYTRAEVCAVLGISERSFWSYVCRYEPGEEGSGPVHPATLDSFMLRGQRRVPYHEISDFLRRNRTYDRLHDSAADQRSLPFPE